MLEDVDMDRNGVAVKRCITNALGEIPLLNVFVVIVIDASSADARYEEDFFPPRRRREESILLCVCVCARARVWSLVFSLTTARAVIVLLNNYKNLPSKFKTSLLLLCLFRYHPPRSHYQFDVHSLKLPR